MWRLTEPTREMRFETTRLDRPLGQARRPEGSEQGLLSPLLRSNPGLLMQSLGLVFLLPSLAYENRYCQYCWPSNIST